MFDKKHIIILIGTIVAIIGLVIWGLQGESDAPTLDPAAIVYYYGDGCPHCKVVQDFLDAEKIAEKVSFTKKEVWKDRKNAKEMDARAKACNIAPEAMGVPFVYGGNGKCYVGEPDVRKFFSERAGIVEKSE